MISWRNVDVHFSESERRRWKRIMCDAARNGGTCTGYSQVDDDEPCDVCKECDMLDIETMEQESVMCGTIYEAAMWHDIENNREHLKKDGEHYVADAMLFRDNLNLRQENESLKKENDSLRKEIDRLVMNSSPTAAELRRVRDEWKKDRDENAKLRNLLVDMAVHMHERALDDSFAYDLWFGDEDAGLTGYAVLLRELGIEVRDD